MTQRWILDEIVDPFGARVVVTRDAVGRATSACFDLSGLPRVDALLSGQPVADVGQDSEYPDLSLRDAAAMRSIKPG